MDSFEALIKNESLQDRVNRMNAWKESRRNADDEYIKRQKIRMFINDCDDIRPALRNQLLIDSKACQLIQIKDQETRMQQIKDFDDAWHVVLSRDFSNKTECQKDDFDKRRQTGLAVQDYLKSQMYEKMHADSQKLHEEINFELEQISIQKKEEEKIEQDRLKQEENARKLLRENTIKQIERNEKMRQEARKKDLEMEKILNKKIEDEMRRAESAKESERQHFRREVFHYLDFLSKTRHQNDMEECKKQKLIDDISKKKIENEWMERCDLVKKRELVNQQARSIQVHQIMEQEKMKIRDAAKEKEENRRFNQHELNERLKLQEEKWKHRVKAHHYGQELLEQKKMDQLRDLAVKQKLDEQLKLAAIEREQREIMGREFVKSCEDVLPLHSNLFIIKSGKKTN